MDPIKEGTPGAPATAQPPVPPQNPPAVQGGLENVTAVQLQELYKKSPDLFKEVVPATPPAPPVAPPPALGAEGELKLELPKDAQVDPKVLDRFKETWAKTPPEKRPQAVVDFYLKLSSEAEEQGRAQFDSWKKRNEEILKADPEFKDFEAARAIAQRPLAKYGDAQLAKELAESGWGNHPGLVKFLHKMGKAMSEDSTRRPPPVSQEIADQKTQLKQRYPSMFKDEPAET